MKIEHDSVEETEELSFVLLYFGTNQVIHSVSESAIEIENRKGEQRDGCSPEILFLRFFVERKGPVRKFGAHNIDR